MRDATLIAMAIVATTAACGGGSVPAVPQPTGPPPLFVRHWDQVCSAGRDPIFMRTEEVLDTVGLGEELRAAGALDSADSADSDGPPELGIVLWYERSGQLEAAARWETSMEPQAAATAEQILASRARSFERLLTQGSFYAVLEAGPEPRARLDRSRTCMPHMRHPDGARAFGLPDTVTTWHGYNYSRRDTTVASVRLTIDSRGAVADVDSLGGPGWAVEAVRKLVPELSFDPALLNGRPVSGVLMQNFRFGRR